MLIEDLGPPSEKPAGENSLGFSPGFKFLSSEIQVSNCSFKSAWIWNLGAFHKGNIFVWIKINLETQICLKTIKTHLQIVFNFEGLCPSRFNLRLQLECQNIERKISLLLFLVNRHANATKNLSDMFIPRRFWI